jgi:hypothetical protein
VRLRGSRIDLAIADEEDRVEVVGCVQELLHRLAMPVPSLNRIPATCDRLAESVANDRVVEGPTPNRAARSCSSACVIDSSW